MRWSTHLGWLAVAAFTVLGCGDAGDAGAPDEFVPNETTFNGFHDWPTAAATAPGDASDGLHGVGPLEVYWNHSPPHGSTSFPVGTIIVKESEEADPTQRIVFAMVKRGGGFNAAGARGWEWFSLSNNADGTVMPLWGGLAAPIGQTYANQPIGDCNGCHAQVSSNDYVWDSALQLANF